MVSENFLNQKELLLSEEQQKRLDWYSKKYGPYIEERGLHNWKNLFRRPTFNECVIFVLLIGYFLVAKLYARDIAVCSETLLNLEADACVLCGAAIQQANWVEPEYPELNVSGITFNNQGG